MSFEYEYYSLLINNTDVETSDFQLHEPPLKFNEVRDSAILNNTQDYDLAIENFKLDTKTIPMFIPSIRPNTNLTTIYKVCIEYLEPVSGIRYLGSQNVIFEPQDKTKAQPSLLDSGYPNYTTGFYNIYNYEWFIVLVNRALRLAQLDLIAVLNANGVSSSFINHDYVPFFIFDKVSQIISLSAPKSYYSNEPEDYLRIALNKPIYRLFNSLPFTTQQAQYQLDGSVITQQLFTINMSNFGLQNSETVDNPPLEDGSLSSNQNVDYITVYQDYSTLDTWTPVDSIVITSSTIPIKSSMRSATHSYINGTETTKGSLNSVEMTITDFKSGSYVNGIIYNPTEKRWINMNQRRELKRINIEVFFRNKLDNALVPLTLNSGGSFSLKFVFRKLKV